MKKKVINASTNNISQSYTQQEKWETVFNKWLKDKGYIENLSRDYVSKIKYISGLCVEENLTNISLTSIMSVKEFDHIAKSLFENRVFKYHNNVTNNKYTEVLDEYRQFLAGCENICEDIKLNSTPNKSEHRKNQIETSLNKSIMVEKDYCKQEHVNMDSFIELQHGKDDLTQQLKQENLFFIWLIGQKGLSDKKARIHLSNMKFVSDFCMETKITKMPLIGINSFDEFNKITNRIREDKMFKRQNSLYRDLYSEPLDNYGKFLLHYESNHEYYKLKIESESCEYNCVLIAIYCVRCS